MILKSKVYCAHFWTCIEENETFLVILKECKVYHGYCILFCILLNYYNEKRKKIAQKADIKLLRDAPL